MMGARTVFVVLLAFATVSSGCLANLPFVGDEEEGRRAATDAPGSGGTGGFSDTHVFAGEYETDGAYSRVLDPGPYDRLPYEVVNLTSEVDGTELSVGLIRPDLPQGEAAPVVVQASPYYDTPFPISLDEPERNGHLLERDLRSHYYVEPLVENFVSHGYAVALLPTRGTGGTGGCLSALSEEQGTEIDQIATWLGTQPWSSGTLGFIGLSQDGAAAWQAASLGNPHVRTIVPIAGFNDVFHLLFQNGTWGAAGPFFAPTESTQATLTHNPPPGASSAPETVASRATCETRLEGLVASAHAAATGERDPLGHWAERNVRPDLLDAYEGSVFNVQGLRDPAVFPHHVYPWIAELEAQDVPVKHLLGQWRHTYPDWDIEEGFNANPTVRWDFAEILLHWFDRWLKGLEAVDLGPRVQVADSEGAWRSAEAWPPRDAEATAFHLTPDGSLSPTAGDETASLLIGADPARIAGVQAATRGAPGDCAGCAVFTTGALEEPLRFAGASWPHLAITPAGPGGYVTAHLYTVSPQDDHRLLTAGQLDLRFAHGGDQARSVTPGETLTARMELNPADAVVPAESELVLVVAQGGYGDDTSFRKLPTPAPMPVTLEVGEGRSTLTLQTFSADEDAFFTPPGTSQPER